MWLVGKGPLWFMMWVVYNLFQNSFLGARRLIFLPVFASQMMGIGNRAVSFSTEDLTLWWDLYEVCSLSCSLLHFMSLAWVPFWRLHVSYRSHEVFCESWCRLMNYVTRCLQCLAACSRTGWTRWSLPGLRSQERIFSTESGCFILYVAKTAVNSLPLFKILKKNNRKGRPLGF